jgi:hypothetical protein
MIYIFIILFSIIISVTLVFIIYYLFCKPVNQNVLSINVINPLYLESPPQLELNNTLLNNKINSNFHNFSIYHTNSEEECIICLEPLNKEKIINLGCLHKYHLNCLVSWWQIDIDKTSCPVCRTKNFLA